MMNNRNVCIPPPFHAELRKISSGTTSTPYVHERRKNKRMNGLFGVAVINLEIVAFLLDISVEGFAFVCDNGGSLAGSVVDIDIVLLNYDLYLPNIRGKVVSGHDSCSSSENKPNGEKRYYLKFADIDPAMYATLSDFISHHVVK